MNFKVTVPETSKESMGEEEYRRVMQDIYHEQHQRMMDATAHISDILHKFNLRGHFVVADGTGMQAAASVGKPLPTLKLRRIAAATLRNLAEKAEYGC